MKTEGITTLLFIEKEDMKKLIAEVKEIVSTIIHLPKEKEVFFESVSSTWSNTR